MSASKLCTRYQFASTIFIAVRWLQRVARRMAAMMCLRAVTVTICFPPDLWISPDLGDVWGRLSMRSAGRRKPSSAYRRAGLLLLILSGRYAAAPRASARFRSGGKSFGPRPTSSRARLRGHHLGTTLCRGEVVRSVLLLAGAV